MDERSDKVIEEIYEASCKLLPEDLRGKNERIDEPLS